MTSVADLLQSVPDPTHGVPLGRFVGHNAYGVPVDGWRVAVEAIWPRDVDAVWDQDEWDGAMWATSQLQDLTGRVRGLSWTRGGWPRPEVGVASITLDNTASPNLSPVNSLRSWGGNTWTDGDDLYVSTFFRPGMPIRIVVFHPDEEIVVPQFTGVVESWNEHLEHAGKEARVEVTLVEPLALLSRVDENALVNVVGNDDTASERIERLADAAGWVFGYDFQTTPAHLDDSFFASWDTFALQSTDMSLNRLAEVYLTVDSVGAVARAGRDGRLTVYRRADPTSTYWKAPTVTRSPVVDSPTWDYFRQSTLTGGRFSDALNPDILIGVDGTEFVFTNSGENVINDVAIARAGGTAQHAQDSSSITRHGRITHTRHDLINKSDTLCAALAASNIQTIETWPSAVQLTQHGAHASTFIIFTDLHYSAHVGFVYHRGGNVNIAAYVTAMRHDVVFAHSAPPVWTASYDLAPYEQPFILTLE